ncbi:hypothetical protein CDAR_514331 [Caerostris darwini]|uniref:Uncharacterized protein n=1 Tax=Caerostris darwini TaxID=1538125 RepID=A0AAV4UNK1_9ARAC|nr:hypothetical protein CDAR_514331 [Caerostris darwini]
MPRACAALQPLLLLERQNQKSRILHVPLIIKSSENARRIPGWVPLSFSAEDVNFQEFDSLTGRRCREIEWNWGKTLREKRFEKKRMHGSPGGFKIKHKT